MPREYGLTTGALKSATGYDFTMQDTIVDGKKKYSYTTGMINRSSADTIINALQAHTNNDGTEIRLDENKDVNAKLNLGNQRASVVIDAPFAESKSFVSDVNNNQKEISDAIGITAQKGRHTTAYSTGLPACSGNGNAGVTNY